VTLRRPDGASWAIRPVEGRVPWVADLFPSSGATRSLRATRSPSAAGSRGASFPECVDARWFPDSVPESVAGEVQRLFVCPSTGSGTGVVGLSSRASVAERVRGMVVSVSVPEPVEGRVGRLLVCPSTGSGNEVAGVSSAAPVREVGSARWFLSRSLSLSKGSGVVPRGPFDRLRERRPGCGACVRLAGVSRRHGVLSRSLSLSKGRCGGCSWALRQAQGPGWLGCRVQRRSERLARRGGSRFGP
jgi:hypothetical protein